MLTQTEVALLTAPVMQDTLILSIRPRVLNAIMSVPPAQDQQRSVIPVQPIHIDQMDSVHVIKVTLTMEPIIPFVVSVSLNAFNVPPQHRVPSVHHQEPLHSRPHVIVHKDPMMMVLLIVRLVTSSVLLVIALDV